jgi:UDP-N-acetylmuramyl pentapeptide synthase
MKTISVVEDFKEKDFNSYLSNVLNMLHVEHHLVHIKSLEEDKLDYLVLNSRKKHFKGLNLFSKFCLANMDNKLQGNINIHANMITYGVGSKNTVTVSSLQDNNEGFMYCLQRYLGVSSEKILEPQDIPVNIKFNSDVELYAAMAAVTIALCEGLSCSEIEDRLSKKLLVLT